MTDQQERMRAVLERLAAWNRNVNGNGYELAEICEEAEVLVKELEVPHGVLASDPLEKLRRCSLGCSDLGQCKATMHGKPSECAADSVGEPFGGRADWPEGACFVDEHGKFYDEQARPLAEVADELSRMANLPEAARRESMYRESACFVCGGQQTKPPSDADK